MKPLITAALDQRERYDVLVLVADAEVGAQPVVPHVRGEALVVAVLRLAERVVTDGVDRLREGDKVKIDDAPAAGARAGKPDGASPGRRDAAPAR